jgi:hypothetical protein
MVLQVTITGYQEDMASVHEPARGPRGGGMYLHEERETLVRRTERNVRNEGLGNTQKRQ